MESVIVRLGLPEDFDAAIGVWIHANAAVVGGISPPPERRAQVRASCANPDAFLVVADNSGVIVGMAVGMHGRDAGGVGRTITGLCFISLVGVLPGAWGQGIGGKLVDALVSAAQSRGYDRAILWAQADNVRAHRLYQGHGFHLTGLHGTNDRGEPNVQYERLMGRAHSPRANATNRRS